MREATIKDPLKASLWSVQFIIVFVFPAGVSPFSLEGGVCSIDIQIQQTTTKYEKYFVHGRSLLGTYHTGTC